MIKKKCKNAKSVCKDYFKLKQISTLNSILNKIDEIKEVYFENRSSEKRIRLKKSLYADVDEELHDYFVNMRHKKAEICSNDLKTKALEIAIGKGYNDFKASNGFIRCFKSRYNVQFKDLHGEAGSVNTATTIDWFNKLANIIKDYASEDIYNLDETGLFIKLKKEKHL